VRVNAHRGKKNIQNPDGSAFTGGGFWGEREQKRAGGIESRQASLKTHTIPVKKKEDP